MIAHYSNQPYRDATSIANHLKARIMASEVDKDIALLASQWIGLQTLKRLMRGLPPLKAVSIKEVMDAKKSAMKEVTNTAEDATEV